MERGATTLHNPDFPVTQAEAGADCARMSASPVDRARPIVVLAGWHQAWPFPLRMASGPLQEMTGASDDEVLAIQYPLACCIPPIVDRVMRRVRERWPSRGAAAEVDVVAVSMGGLVARLCALRGALAIRRLFTIVTPHRGAKLAGTIFLDSASCSMRPGSPLLASLDESFAARAYELTCYARLNDIIVGATHTAPEGMAPFWLSGTRVLSHIRSCGDVRILADIARRLRGEEPFARRATMPPMD